MRDRDFSDKEAKIWRILVLSLFAIIIGGGFWAVNKYVPPQHLFWKPLDTNPNSNSLRSI